MLHSHRQSRPQIVHIISSHSKQPPSVKTFGRVYDRKKEHRWCKPLKSSAKDSSQDLRIFGVSLCDVKYLAPCYKRWCNWLGHCATSRKVASSIQNGSLGFFIGIILPAALSLQQRIKTAADCSDTNTDCRLLTHQSRETHQPHLMKDSSTALTVICAEAGE
jgi:hypothetical protein